MIFDTVLTKKASLLATDDDDDDYDPGYGGYWTIPVNIRAGLSIHKVLEYIIMPELITEFIMYLFDLSYKEASIKLYVNSLPTIHHIDTLLLTAGYIRKVSGITIQCVLGDLSEQWTHGILNVTDNYMSHKNSIANSIKEKGGSRVEKSCAEYVKQHGLSKLMLPLFLREILDLIFFFMQSLHPMVYSAQ